MNPELLGRRSASRSIAGSVGLEAAPMGLAHDLDVELLLVAEVVVDRRQVRPRPLADRPDPRQLEPLLGKLLARRLQQPYLRRICATMSPCIDSKQPFQTTVSIKCIDRRRISSMAETDNICSVVLEQTAAWHHCNGSSTSLRHRPDGGTSCSRLLESPSSLSSESTQRELIMRAFEWLRDRVGASTQDGLRGPRRRSLSQASVDRCDHARVRSGIRPTRWR